MILTKKQNCKSKIRTINPNTDKFIRVNYVTWCKSFADKINDGEVEGFKTAEVMMETSKKNPEIILCWVEGY